jgi:hypothetical protein
MVLSGSYTPYCGSLITAHKSGYDQFPPMTNGWGTKYLVSDMVPPLLVEEEGLLTETELDSGIIRTGPPPHHNDHGQA